MLPNRGDNKIKTYHTMAKVIDEKIKRQLEKKTTFFLKYFPVRIKNVWGTERNVYNGAWPKMGVCFDVQ